MKAKWLWLAALGLSTACSDPGGPNGKQEVLFFYEANDTVAEGLEAEVLIPGEESLGDDTKGLERLEFHEFDFEDTTLKVDPASGVSVVEVRQVQEEHYGRSYRIRYRCEAGGAPKRELRVRVLDDDGDERYADAFDVSCAKATGLAVSLVGAPGDGQPEGMPARYIMGSKMWANFDLTDATGAKLKGTGSMELVDPQGLVRLLPRERTYTHSVSFEPLKPGTGLKVRYLGLEVAVPFEVVPDASIAITVQAPYDANNKLWFARAEARYEPTGGLLGGFNDCTWELRPTGGTPSTERRECWKTFGVEASTNGTVCVSARGKTGCTEYKQ